jgi:hypothetical protein
MFFDLELTLCDRFPSLTPFDIRKQSVYEVFLLIRRLNKTVKTTKKKNRRPAGDNWF